MGTDSCWRRRYCRSFPARGTLATILTPQRGASMEDSWPQLDAQIPYGWELQHIRTEK